MIGFAREQRFGFQLADVRFRAVQLFGQIFEQVFALRGVGFFFGQADVGFDVVGKCGQLFVGGDLIFRAFAIAQYGLRFVLIVPEIRIGGAGF
jgi:hypothetical protein